MAKPNIPNQPKIFQQCNNLSIQTAEIQNFVLQTFRKRV